MKIKTFLFTTSFILMFGCSKHELPLDNPEETLKYPINISSEVSKLTTSGFENGDEIGLFAVNYANTDPGTLEAEGNQADNVKYIYDGTKWTPVKAVYYKDIHTNVDLYLYYPHQETITDIDESTFEVQKDQSTEKTPSVLSGYEASDFLWGKGENITPKQSAVQVELKHKLSTVRLTLIEGTGFEEGEFESLEKSAILTNTTRKATLDFNTGTATPVGEPQADGIVMCPQSDGSFRAIVIPQTVPSDTKLFAITLGGVSYSYKENNATIYQTGKQLSVSITVNKKTPSGEYELSLSSSQIVDWTSDQNVYGAEARQYYVVNLEEPGTLQATIEAAGKNPAKIKNLKIIGKVTTKDFNFMHDNMTILEAVNMKESKIINASKDYSGTNKADDIIPYQAFYNKKTLCYYVFPEKVTYIGVSCFSGTSLAGALIIPDDVEIIGSGAFNNTQITSLSLPNKLKEIGQSAFANCESVSGNLLIPNSVEDIGGSAFSNSQFNGTLHLPEKIEIIKSRTFSGCKFIGNLIIPEKVKSIEDYAFYECGFNGKLVLNNVSTLGTFAFCYCKFQGELVIPEGVIEIPNRCFYCNNFNSIIFPSTLKSIDDYAFYHNTRISEPLIFPEGFLSCGEDAFQGCSNIPSITFPSTFQSIGAGAFAGCYGISNIVCNAIEPPTVQSSAFDGVAKDNFTVEVPSQSIKRYQSESGWSDFKRFSAHHDFSVSRNRMRALNGTKTNTYTLRVPSGFQWSIESKPDWVTVSPASGTGKTDITVTIAEMARTSETFEVNEGTFTYPKYVKYKGRAGKIIFNLDGKDYTCSMDIEQYDYNYADGDVITYQTKTSGSGIDIVFIGDGYDAKDIAKGTFLANAEAGFGHLFDIEPYKSYKDYFNVYAVISMSDDSGIGTVNTIVDTKFGSSFSQNRILTPEATSCFKWAKKANPSMDLTKSLTIMLMNTSTYEGICMLYGDGSAIACCPVSQEEYPYNFRGVIQHEAGGHGFGKLGDEYIYHNAFITTCSCTDGCEHPSSDNDIMTYYGRYKALGWYKNLSMISDNKKVPWAHLIYHNKYSDYVDMYEGGYMHTRGIYRSEATSCMNNNIPYYSAISRQAIVERIKLCAGETFDQESFYNKDKDDFGTKAISSDRTFGVDPKFNKGTGRAPIYMGEHPNL